MPLGQGLIRLLHFDPQTSGGLLISFAPDDGHPLGFKGPLLYLLLVGLGLRTALRSLGARRIYKLRELRGMVEREDAAAAPAPG